MSSSPSRQHYQHTCCCPLYLFMPVCVRSLMFLTFDFILTPFYVTLQTGQRENIVRSTSFSRLLQVHLLSRLRLHVRRDDPPCPSGSAALWWACRLLCQRWCPAGTRRWGGAPTLASHPPWLTCGFSTTSQLGQKKTDVWHREYRRDQMQIEVHSFACKARSWRRFEAGPIAHLAQLPF